MAEMSSIENHHGFWLLLDLAFSSLHSSTEESQKENIITNIESCLVNSKEWTFLTNINSKNFFSWLVGNYSNILLKKEFGAFHKRITLSLATLVNTLSTVPVLFNIVIKTLLHIVKIILDQYSEISSGVCSKIVVFADLSVPFGIKNDFSIITLQKDATLSSLISCFYEVCYRNYDLIAYNGGLYVADLVNVLLCIAENVTYIKKQDIGKIIIFLASQFWQLLRVEEWDSICSKICLIESNTELLDAFFTILENFNTVKSYSKIHLLLLDSTIKFINIKCADSTVDISKFSIMAKSYINIIPTNDLKLINIISLLPNISSKEVCGLLSAYLVKTIESYIASENFSLVNQSCISLSKENSLWKDVLFKINVYADNFLSTKGNNLQAVDHINNIFSIANSLCLLESKYNCKFILYDVIVDCVFNIFLMIKEEYFLKEDVMFSFIELCKNCIKVIEEQDSININYIILIYELLLNPWKTKPKDLYIGRLKSQCYEVLNSLLICTLNVKELIEFSRKLTEILYEIAFSEKFLMDLFFHALCICVLGDKFERDIFIKSVELFFTKECIGVLLQSSKVRNLIPCFINNRCFLVRGSQGLEMKCLDCDTKDTDKTLNKPQKICFKQYSDFIGLSFIKLLAQNETDSSLKIELMNSVEKYVYHLPNLKSDQLLYTLPEFMTSLALTNEYPIKDILKGFLFDHEYNFSLINAKIVVNQVLGVFKDETFDPNLHLSNVLEFLVDLTYSSKTFILPTVKVLFLVIFGCSSTDVEILKKQLFKLLTYHEMDEWDLLIMYEKELSELWVDMIITNIQNEKCDPEDTILYIAEVFNMTPSDFLEFRSTPYMIAYIFSTCSSDQSNYILSCLSEILHTTVKDIILKSFVIIFPMVYFLDDETTIADALNCIEIMSEKSIDILIYYSFKDLVCYIIMNSDKPVRVIRFFESFVFKEEPIPKTCGEMLSGYTVGFLTFVDAKLLSKSTPLFIIKSCLCSIPHLIKMLGISHVAKIRIKLLATLRTGLPLHYESYPQECLEAWIYFLYSVNLSFLGPYLTTIVTLLMPLFSKFPTDVSNTLYYLVVKKGNLYYDYLPELFFLQKSSAPLMDAVCAKIRSVTKRIGIIDGLSKTLKHIRNGAVESRIHSLEYLYHQIKLRRNDLLLIIHQSDKLPILLHEIIDCLMMNVHYGNLEVRTICVSCLGEIGAINPARFNYAFRNDELRKYVSVDTEDFAFLIIMELTKSLQKSQDSLAYNTIANSIQELLKLYFPNQKPEKIKSFLSKFPQNESNILYSMLGSKYIFDLQEPVIIKKKNEKPGLNTGKSVFEWSTSWASELVALMPAESFVRDVFRKCLPGIQKDSESMEALLPHILLQAILSCSKEDANFIATEMKGILKFQEKNLLIAPHSINLYQTCTKLPVVDVFHMEITNEKGVAVILDLIDFLFKYFSFLKISKESGNHVTIISEFLQKFPNNFISLKSYIFEDYCRSLFYLERKSSNLSSVNSSPLRNIYAKLNDSDGLLGVIRKSERIPTIEENMLNHVVCGNVQEALPAYELLSTKEIKSTDCCRALVQCYLNINSPYVAVKLSHTLFSLSGEYSKISFCSEIVESAWKNLMFDEVQNIIGSFNNEMKNNWSWCVDLGCAYLDLFNLNFVSLKSKIKSIRQNIGERLAVISNTTLGAYRQGYRHIVSLHLLSELEMFAQIVDEIYKPNAKLLVPKLFEKINMGARLQLLPSNGYFIEKIMNSRIQILSMMSKLDNIPTDVKPILDSELGIAYLRAAQITRKNLNLQLSATYLALAEHYQPLGFLIEKAKLHEAKHEIDNAIIILKQGVIQYSQPTSQCVDSTLSKLSAHAKLLIARYNEENINVDYTEGTKNYKDAINTFPTEKNYLYLAKYLYKIHSIERGPPDRSANKCEIQVQAIKNFGSSLFYGCNYIYQSMFCMISLWLDFGTRLKAHQDASKHVKNATKMYEEFMDQMDKLMDEYFEAHPTYMYMAVFSQLLSRINHPLPKCQMALVRIISKVAVDYPQQAFWMMAPIWKTEDAEQNKLGMMILQKMKQHELNSRKQVSITKFYSIFNKLVDILINICNKKIPNDKTTIIPLKSISQKLKILLKTNPNKIMIPAQKFRTISLPKIKHFTCPETKLRHNAFPLMLSYFVDVDDDVQVIFSLQRPKKLVFRGSDGIPYPFMCKPMDDLRLDSRIMEFSSVVNKYLQRDPASCDRNLHINTYSVVPINPLNGLIEWVPNLLGYRSILLKMFKMKSYKLPGSTEIKNKIEGCKTVDQKLKLFDEVLLPMHPPVLHKWFFHQFSSPDSWYLARKSFVRTAAVMSIVGYVVGLGDRHGENILLDTITGEVMHVDFNCLFGRGELFLVPEVVPFRLTQNMVEAMGSTGIEGHFMKACEITNRVIRNHCDQLLYVLKPFLYDPKLQKNPNAENKAQSDINNINKKMVGHVITPIRRTQALSVEGQVRCLIAEATSHVNLCQMFHGWNSFL